MSFLDTCCIFEKLRREVIECSGNFSCTINQDIESFFKQDFQNYSNHLLGKSYCFVHNIDKPEVVAAFTVSNSSIALKQIPKRKRNQLNRSIPNVKRKSQYPAVLIGQLAVFDKFRNMHLGSEILNFIKYWFIEESNKTGCRYLIVDAVNNHKVIDFYKNNGFELMFSSVEEEITFLQNYKLSFLQKIRKFFGYKTSVDIYRNTRLMYFDLICLDTTY